MRWLIALSLLLVACSSSKTVTNIDEHAWGYEATYNTQSNTKAAMQISVEVEDGILFFPFVETSTGTKTGMLYHNFTKDSISIINANPNAVCTFSNLENCSSTINGTFGYFQYFNHHIYYVAQEMDPKTEQLSLVLRRFDLQGQNEEKLFTIQRNINNQESYGFSYTIHKGYLYYAFDKDNIYKINMEKFEEEEFLDFKGADRIRMFFYNDIAYINVINFEDGGILYSDVIYKVDLNNNTREVLLEGISAYHIDEDNIIYGQQDPPSTYIYNFKTGEHKKIVDDFVVWVYRTDNYYVIDGVGMSDDSAGNIYLIDMLGNMLDSIESPYIFHRMSQGVINNRYYIYEGDTFMYFPIIDNTFGELQEVTYEE